MAPSTLLRSVLVSLIQRSETVLVRKRLPAVTRRRMATALTVNPGSSCAIVY